MIMSLNPRVWFDQLRPMPKGKDIVIVAGMPKSGTTVIAKLLGAACGEAVCSDPFYQLDMMNVDFREKLYGNQLSLESLWKQYKRTFSGTVIKDPNFPFLLPQIIRLFPDAKFVFIIRDPRDNIRSVLDRLNLPGNPKNSNLDQIKHYKGWYNLLAGKAPEVHGEDYIEILAWRWRMAAEAFLKYEEVGVEIRYEDFMVDKNAAICGLANQLGYSELSKIEDLLDIQYQPKGKASVRWDEFYGHEQLKTINRITGPLLETFNYKLIQL